MTARSSTEPRELKACLASAGEGHCSPAATLQAGARLTPAEELNAWVAVDSPSGESATPGASDWAAAYVKGARTPPPARPLTCYLAVQGSAAFAAISRRMA
jgi:hypothetical protein